MRQKKFIVIIILAAALLYLGTINKNIYSSPDNWAYFAIGSNKPADLFLICPTVDRKDEYNMSLSDTETKRKFLGALNMERGIYEANTRMYAPYYRQAAMKVSSMTREEGRQYLELAYKDISQAFSYYLEHENNGRPIILAGFSQGADMCYRILHEFFNDTEGKLYKQLVAVYAIGWPLDVNMTDIKPARSESDIGVVISFECESERVTSTPFYPAGVKAHAINPLNWKTDNTPADKSLNLGACFTNYDGEIQSEIKNFCGGYLDTNRGVLKITGINEADYPPVISLLPEGAFHVYDYMFLFRNLQENVKTRIKAFMQQ